MTRSAKDFARDFSWLLKTDPETFREVSGLFGVAVSQIPEFLRNLADELVGEDSPAEPEEAPQKSDKPERCGNTFAVGLDDWQIWTYGGQYALFLYGEDISDKHPASILWTDDFTYLLNKAKDEAAQAAHDVILYDKANSVVYWERS